MLPYTPAAPPALRPRCPAPTVPRRGLVLTSGNLGGEPICFDDDDALTRLAGLADAFLRHDRPIDVSRATTRWSRVVDGIEVADPALARVRTAAGRPALRRSRPPWPSAASSRAPAAWRRAATPGSASTSATWTTSPPSRRSSATSERPLEMLPASTPASAGRRRAPRLPIHRLGGRARRWPDRVSTVQHHHAHIASVMAEHGLDGATPVIGFAFDGTGYGTGRRQPEIWGGEVLLADYRGSGGPGTWPTCRSPAATRSRATPYRMALAHLAAAGIDLATGPARRWPACPTAERHGAAPTSSTPASAACRPPSMGRLFDAVASLLGIRQLVNYEAQAAIELEGAGPGRAADAVAATASVWTTTASSIPRRCSPGSSPACGGRRRRRRSAARSTGRSPEPWSRLGRRARRRQPALGRSRLGGGVFQNALLLGSARRLAGRPGSRSCATVSAAPQRRRPGARPGLVAATATGGADPMCLGVPGRVVSIAERPTAPGWPTSTSAA